MEGGVGQLTPAADHAQHRVSRTSHRFRICAHCHADGNTRQRRAG